MDEAEAKKRIEFWNNKKKMAELKGDVNMITRAEDTIKRIKAAPKDDNVAQKPKLDTDYTPKGDKKTFKVEDTKKESKEDKGGIV